MAVDRRHDDCESERGVENVPGPESVVARLERLWSNNPGRDSPLLSLSGKKLGAYRIESPIGYGSFGVVYRARDEELERDVAVKIPRPEVLLDEEKRVRFESEAATAATLDHPSIVSVYSANLRGPTPFIASAFCGGPNLREWLAERSTPSHPRQAANFLIKVVDAVQYAHTQGVVHRDLKPSNILLEPTHDRPPQSLDDFNPKLTDFGLAKWSHGSLQDTRSSLILGTPLYMAPEQVTSDYQNANCATDVYSLGVLLFELLTLKTPFASTKYFEVVERLLKENAPPLKALRGDVPADLQAICAKCLEKDPSDRYRSAGELADELRRFVADQPIQTAPHSIGRSFSRWCRRPDRLAAAGRYTMALQLAIVSWVIANLVTVAVLDLLPREVFRHSLHDFLFVTSVMHLPKAWLGWKLIHGRLWAFWPSAITSMIMLGIFIDGATRSAVAFDYNYPTPLSKVQVFSVLIMGCSWGTGLHLVGIPAWFRSRQKRTHALSGLNLQT